MMTMDDVLPSILCAIGLRTLIVAENLRITFACTGGSSKTSAILMTQKAY